MSSNAQDLASVVLLMAMAALWLTFGSPRPSQLGPARPRNLALMIVLDRIFGRPSLALIGAPFFRYNTRT